MNFCVALRSFHAATKTSNNGDNKERYFFGGRIGIDGRDIALPVPVHTVCFFVVWFCDSANPSNYEMRFEARHSDVDSNGLPAKINAAKTCSFFCYRLFPFTAKTMSRQQSPDDSGSDGVDAHIRDPPAAVSQFPSQPESNSAHAEDGIHEETDVCGPEESARRLEVEAHERELDEQIRIEIDAQEREAIWRHQVQAESPSNNPQTSQASSQTPPLVIGAPLGKNLTVVEAARRLVAQWEAIHESTLSSTPDAAGPILEELVQARAQLDALTAHQQQHHGEEDTHVPLLDKDPVTTPLNSLQAHRDQAIASRIKFLTDSLQDSSYPPEHANITAAISLYRASRIPYSANWTLIYAGHLVDFAPTYASFTADRATRLARYSRLHGEGWLWIEPPLARDAGGGPSPFFSARKSTFLPETDSTYDMGHYSVTMSFRRMKSLAYCGAEPLLRSMAVSKKRKHEECNDNDEEAAMANLKDWPVVAENEEYDDLNAASDSDLPCFPPRYTRNPKSRTPSSSSRAGIKPPSALRRNRPSRHPHMARDPAAPTLHFRTLLDSGATLPMLYNRDARALGIERGSYAAVSRISVETASDTVATWLYEMEPLVSASSPVWPAEEPMLGGITLTGTGSFASPHDGGGLVDMAEGRDYGRLSGLLPFKVCYDRHAVGAGDGEGKCGRQPAVLRMEHEKAAAISGYGEKAVSLVDVEEKGWKGRKWRHWIRSERSNVRKFDYFSRWLKNSAIILVGGLRLSKSIRERLRYISINLFSPLSIDAYINCYFSLARLSQSFNMSFSRFLNRPRSSTKVLLGDAYVENPPPTLSAYDDKRLRHGLSFADQTLRQTQRKIYKTTLKAVLEQDYDGEKAKEKLFAQVQTYEQLIFTRRFLRGPRDAAQASLVERLTELRQYEFAARYGDYQARLCKKLKLHAQTFQTKNYEKLQGWDRYWTQIQEELQAEKPLYKRYRLGDNKVIEDDVATTLAVYEACKKMYANRNDILHAPIQEIASQGRPARCTRGVLQEIIDACIDEFFDRSGIPALADDRWRIREEAERFAAQQEKASEIRKANIEKSRRKILAAAVKAASKLMEDYKSAQLAVKGMGIKLDDPVDLVAPTGSIPPDIKSLKRPRTDAERIEQDERFKRQKKAWDAIVSLQSQCQNRYKQYQDDYNTTEPPVDPATWFDLATPSSSQPGSSGSERWIR
ncbi:hypothetical protein CCUS01_15248 [Colletotrichum cuscutae]|uniref:Uncharacterized protein n=1 Tax=Colletotrichum cuscutae TaxID=1209917 RepID=A0AAI9VEP8_9PEZI|nr:hypothetical protein CCUS01_15248 [Colletotrichum cuscutae]